MTTELVELADKWQAVAAMHSAHAESVSAKDPIESGIFKAAAASLLGASTELRALASRAGGWRTIDSAPRDGSFIWLADESNIRVGFWPGWKDDPEKVTGRCWADMASSESRGPWGLHFAPTHWQPIPEPPAAPEPGAVG